ncbi:MAG: hypothetical protein BEU01_01675 [Marine Group III euryarchaeote CG-Epi4]|uniref:Uncharacterized protein n=1 Tax=Marine Group III euryarchaeote CG-Epi4 TaxID=1888998 RepID=A0A1J5TK65_9ARCH|nr:MAG: hypothetical protein BEU01_01675 [Marine Group III euryarchaeote CG-Epi4]|tara:strand:+ start:34 stop:984 length:951 start_codon:yes stop_codon:yes gene_type:complete
MEAIILVGGLGTRLRPLTKTIPKPLLPLGNIPMVERMILNLPERIDTVILAVNYGIEQMLEYFKQTNVGRKVIIVPENEPLGTGGAMKNCEKYITGTTAVFNGDVVTSLDLEEMIEYHNSKKAKGTLALWEVDNPNRFGVVKLVNGEILEFQEKPPKGEELSNLINAGTYLLEPEIINMIPENKKVSVERDIYPKIVGNGLFGMPFEGHFIDAGTPESYLEANFKLLKAKNDEENNKIKDNVQIHETSEIVDSIIGPNVVVGPDTFIEKSMISNSVILSDSKIYGATISNSIIGPKISLKKDVENTVIAPEGEKVF